MRTVPSAWTAALASGSCTPVELYEITLDDETLYYSNSGNDVVFPIVGGATYSGIQLKRSPIEVSLDGAITEVTATIDDIELELVDKLAPDKFQGRTVTIKKIIYECRNSSDDYLLVFRGVIDSVNYSNGALGLKIIFNFGMGSLNATVPRRKFCQHCNYKFGDDSCGVDKESAANKVSGVITEYDSDKVFYDTTNLTQAANYWVPGMMVFTSGLNDGEYREVSAFSAGQITVRVPFTWFPDYGDTFVIYRICNKTVSDCSTRFNNYANYGGFAEIPKTPVV